MNYVVQAHRTLFLLLIGFAKFSCLSHAKTKTLTTCDEMRLQVLKHYYSIQNSVACTAHGQISDIITFDQTHNHSLGLSRWLTTMVELKCAIILRRIVLPWARSYSRISIRRQMLSAWLAWNNMAWHHKIHFLTHWQHFKCWSFFSNSLLRTFVLFNYYYYYCMRSCGSVAWVCELWVQYIPKACSEFLIQNDLLKTPDDMSTRVG